MKRSDHLLDLDAQPALRLRALEQLATAAHAAQRLGGDDPEAIHDFRVALRQLRTTLSVFREHFAGSVTRKQRRRLAKLSRATGAARDAQVGLGILSTIAPALADTDGVMRLRSLLVEGASESFTNGVVRRFGKVARRLQRELATYTVHLDPARPMVVRPFQAAVRESARDCAARLQTCLLDIKEANDSVPIHLARIAGKRLRYVLAPLGRDRTIAHALVELSWLQELLGTLADVECLRLRAACVRAAGDDEGLAKLEGLLRELHARAYAELRSGWLASGGAIFFERLLGEL